MSAGTVTLRVLRPCLVYGQRVTAGTKVELPPLQALGAVETGRLDFVDSDDRARCVEARRQEIARELRTAPADPGSPWRPAGMY